MTQRCRIMTLEKPIKEEKNLEKCQWKLCMMQKVQKFFIYKEFIQN